MERDTSVEQVQTAICGVLETAGFVLLSDSLIQKPLFCGRLPNGAGILCVDCEGILSEPRSPFDHRCRPNRSLTRLQHDGYGLSDTILALVDESFEEREGEVS